MQWRRRVRFAALQQLAMHVLRTWTAKLVICVERPCFSAVQRTSTSATPCGQPMHMSQVQPSGLPVFRGNSTGNIPNLFWRRLSSDQLRQQNQYNELPPVEQLQFECTADYR